MHKLEVGIEHLMTGLCLYPADGHGIQFHRVSASIVAAVSDAPFWAQWPHATVNMNSVDCGNQFDSRQYGYGEMEWYAQVMAAEMRAIDNIGRTDKNLSGLPEEVVIALRRKHGKDANMVAKSLTYSGVDGCWFYSHAGMVCGVERDGYIHT